MDEKLLEKLSAQSKAVPTHAAEEVISGFLGIRGYFLSFPR